MPAAAQLADAASAGAAAKQVDLDIQAYQKARNVFVNAIKVRNLCRYFFASVDAVVARKHTSSGLVTAHKQARVSQE